MALTTEQQTSHLSRLQQEILAWDYYRMGGEDDPGAAAGRTLREVPKTFASINEYLDVFEPLVLEECAAQVCRGEEGDTRPSNVGAVLSSERLDGFHVVKFVLGEEAMREFRDNDLVLVAKTDPAPNVERTSEGDAKKGSKKEETKDSKAKGEDKKDKDKDKKGKKGDKKEVKDEAEDEDEDKESSEFETMFALGFVDGRDSRNVMRVRFHLPEASGGQGVFKRRAALTDDDFTRFRSMRNALATPKSAWYLMHLANMSTIAREWLALHAFPALPFAHTILGGTPAPKAAHSSWELPEPLSKAIESAYNDSQLTALKAALEKQPITLIQGPPGTGKTRIILSLLSVILHAVPGVKSGLEIDLRRFLETRDERKPLSPAENASVHRRAAPWMCGASNPRDAPPPPRDAPQIPTPPPEKAEIVGERENRRTKVLVCAPSNSALDEIVLRIMHSGLLGPNGTSYSPTLVRVGVNVHHSVESVSMEALVRERVGEVGDLAAGAAASSEKKFERALEKDRVKLAILDEAAVVCSTLSFSGSGMFARMTSQFDVVVIDEAAQAVEPSTLVPLCYGAKQVFLVGDPRQLPATVLSSIATEHNYNQSLFKRFEQCGYPIHLLKTQYRMHPAIREFPSTRFYAGELEDGPRMAQKTKRPWHDNLLFRPFVFIDVASGKEYRGGGMSWANDEEATLAVALVAVLVKNYPELASGEKIGVISPYKAQVKNIRRKLAEQLGEERARKVDVNSIDGFQGREKDVCIFSVVRAPTSGKGLGFVADERRINVGLTRSKSSLIVLGSAKALKGDDNWGGLVASARDRNLIVKPNGKDLKAFVAKHGAIYDADDLSGSEDDVGAEVADDDDDDDGYGAATGLEHGGDGAGARGVKGHVHRPEWLVSSHLAVEAAEALRRGAGSPALPGVGLDGFAARGVEDELVSEAPNRKVGDDYGAGNDEGDEADPYAQETEAPAKTSARAKRTRAAAATTEKKVPEKKGKAAATAAAKEDTASPPPAAKRTRRGGS